MSIRNGTYAYVSTESVTNYNELWESTQYFVNNENENAFSHILDYDLYLESTWTKVRNHWQTSIITNYEWHCFEYLKDNIPLQINRLKDGKMLFSLCLSLLNGQKYWSSFKYYKKNKV